MHPQQLLHTPSPLCITSFTTTSALGAGRKACLDALLAQKSGLSNRRWETVELDTWIGEVAGVDELKLREDLAAFDSRNNRLAQLALMQDGFMREVQRAVGQYGAKKVGVFMGTSTSGILSTELAYRERDAQSGALPEWHSYRHTHSMFSIADFVRLYTGALGPAYVVSTACSSSAKVFGIAQRLIGCGLIDAAIVGGVDSLCLTTLYGFNSLQLVSANPCRPFDENRDGISIGEAAAFALLERADHAKDDDVILRAVGESSDAHHMSSPHPDGLGAKIAMQKALDLAGIAPEQVSYINLHGTATQNNDAAEQKAVSAIFGKTVPCSSTKGYTGHTLGAAGAVEAVMCALALQNDLLPAGAGTSTVDASFHVDYLLENRNQKLQFALSNSFGFGGSNCSLLLERKSA